MSVPLPRVAVIGAGMSGLHIAKKLKDMDVPFEVYEKASEIGGTWRDNRYPGLFVDAAVSQFQLGFAPKHDWSRAFAPGPEVQSYLLALTEDHDLRRHIRFDTEFVSADWTGGHWELRTAAGQVITADVVVAATGFLRVPTLPRVPGMDTFAGPSFHSSQWPEGLDVRGKRVAVVGSGSSGIQLTSALAYTEGVRVTQFVRTPQWVETIDNPAADEDSIRRIRENPETGADELAALEEGINQDVRLRDPRWKLRGAGQSRDEGIEALREDLLAIEDPALRAILTPEFSPGCKRIPKSPNYYQAVQEPNVRIVPHGVDRVEAGGVYTPDGEFHEFDVIVYATGFDAHAYMRPMQVTGLDGQSLDDMWSDGPFSYRGVALPRFPNFFMLHGPFSPVNNVPVPASTENQAGYICRLIELIGTQDVAVWPADSATDRFRQWVRDEVPETVWAGNCASWYKGSDGEAIIWPWYDTEQEAMFAQLDLADLELSVRQPSGADVTESDVTGAEL